MTRALLAALAAALLVGAVQTYRIERIKPQLHDARQALKEWEGYQKGAQVSADEAARQCQARVDDARRSAQRIQTIVERPYEVDPSGCPVRDLLPGGELRDALTPSAGSAP